MIPSTGRIVHYKLTGEDADQINRRRTSHTAIKAQENWPEGAQAHIGNHAHQGDVFAAMIVKTWGIAEGSCANLQVFLDGNDTYWATSRSEGELNGMWSVPPRV